MKHVTSRFAIGLLLFALLQFGCPGTKTEPPKTEPPKQQTPAEQLLDASKKAGVQVHAEEVFTVSRGSGSDNTTVSPIAGWEKIPATELPKGVDIGFGYFSEVPNVPKGYYKLRAFAEPKEVGTVDGRVQFIDQGGKMVAEVPTQIEVHSLTLPAEAATQRSFVVGSTNVRERRLFEYVWMRCPNGVCILVPIRGPRDIIFQH